MQTGVGVTTPSPGPKYELDWLQITSAHGKRMSPMHKEGSIGELEAMPQGAN